MEELININTLYGHMTRLGRGWAVKVIYHYHAKILPWNLEQLGWPWQQLTQWQNFVDTCSSNANLKQRGNVSEQSSHWHQPEIILDTALFDSRLLAVASSSLSSSSSSSSRSSPAWLSSKQTFWQVLMCSLTRTRGWTGWFTLYQLWARRKVQKEMGPGLLFRVEKGPKKKERPLDEGLESVEGESDPKIVNGP